MFEFKVCPKRLIRPLFFNKKKKNHLTTTFFKGAIESALILRHKNFEVWSYFAWFRMEIIIHNIQKQKINYDDVIIIYTYKRSLTKNLLKLK